MFFVTAKVLWFLLQPSSLLIGAVLAGALLAPTRWCRLGRRLAWGGAVALLICGLTPLGDVLIRPLEARFPRAAIDSPAMSSARPIAGIIVLGGGEDGHAADSPQLAALNEADGPVFKIRNDPRVTAVGWWMRRLSLDELPQLWNILKGDMSFVGPRPPLASEVEKYERWQRRRLRMRPGLTCLWALEGRSELSFSRWMELDMAYIDNWSLWLDLKILLKTIPRVLLGRGAA